MNLITLDFETYYDVQLSLSKMSTVQYVQHPVEWSVPLGPRQCLRRRVSFGRNPVLLSLQKAQGSFTNMTNMQSN